MGKLLHIILLEKKLSNFSIPKKKENLFTNTIFSTDPRKDKFAKGKEKKDKSVPIKCRKAKLYARNVRNARVTGETHFQKRKLDTATGSLKFERKVVKQSAHVATRKF